MSVDLAKPRPDLPVILTCGGPLHRPDAIVICLKRHVIARGQETVGFFNRGYNGTQRSENGGPMPLLFRCALYLICAGQKLIECSALVALLYGDDASGGPLYARDIVKIYIWQLRKRLARLRIKLHATWSFGGAVRVEIGP